MKKTITIAILALSAFSLSAQAEDKGIILSSVTEETTSQAKNLESLEIKQFLVSEVPLDCVFIGRYPSCNWNLWNTRKNMKTVGEAAEEGTNRFKKAFKVLMQDEE